MLVGAFGASAFGLRGGIPIVRVQCQPNQRAGTDRHATPNRDTCLQAVGQATPRQMRPRGLINGLLLPLIKVPPDHDHECAVNALDAGAMYKCVTVTFDVQTNRHTRHHNGRGVSITAP